MALLGLRTLTVIDEAARTVVSTVTVGTGPVSVAVDLASGRIFVANSFDDTVSVIDPETLEVVRTLCSGGRPWDISLDTETARMYVANAGSDSVSVFDNPGAAGDDGGSGC